MLQTRRKGSVLYLTLDRPEVRNAFNDELIAAIHSAFDTLDPEVRAVVIRGNGKAFCAGGDLEWMKKASGYDVEQNYSDALKLARMLQAIHTCPAVTIVLAHGAAFGGGCGLVSAADYSIAQKDTKFCFSEVRLGLIPATISPFVIDRIGKGTAKALFTTAEVFDGNSALRIGLVNKVVEFDSELEVAAEKLVDSVLQNGPQAVAACKSLIREFPISLEECARLLASARSSVEGKEGVAAFLEKRKASFAEERR
jgi:enoyl-CoA hydratase/carnithine racemase